MKTNILYVTLALCAMYCSIYLLSTSQIVGAVLMVIAMAIFCSQIKVTLIKKQTK